MKKTGLLLLAGTALLWMSCGQQANVKTLLSNQDSKEQIFETIVSDHGLMTEFMGKMMGDEHAMMMIKGDHDMMNATMSEMMKDGQMMGDMMKMMHEQGMMSTECMQSCMQMMGDKGMMQGGGDDGDEGQGDHDAHH